MSGIRRAPIVVRDPGIVCWKCLQCYQYVVPWYRVKEYYLFGLWNRHREIVAYQCNECLG
jgi:hypothetical protein